MDLTNWFKTYASGTVEVSAVMPKKDTKDKKDKTKKAWYDQQDLQYIKSIFLSTGENLNDDEFLPEEVAMALDTIANKPINKEHKDQQIVGHMFAASIMDKNGNTIKAGLEYDMYFTGVTSKQIPEGNDHTHTWRVIVDSDGKVLAADTSWDNGHRHQISAADAKNGKTAPGSVGNHTHKLLPYSEYSADQIPLMQESVVVAAETEKKSLPTDFHVVDEGVLYKGVHAEYVNKVLEDAQNGKAFVSMETYFRNYDYKVGGKLIARNSETSFLDASLRANGGNGTFDGKKVTRVLRDLHFAGKGIVKQPANPPSIIFAEKTPEVLTAEEKNNLWNKIDKNCVEYTEINKTTENTSVGDIIKDILQTSASTSKGDIEMETKVTATETVKPVIDTAELDAAKKQVEAFAATAVKKDIEIAELKKKNEVLVAEVEAAAIKFTACDKELKEIKSAAIAEKRKVDFASFDISVEDEKEVIEEIKSMDDAAYAKYLAKAKRLFKVKAAVPVVTPAPVPPATPEAIAATAEKAVATALANKETPAIQGSGDVDSNKAIATRVAESIFGKKEKK